MPKEVLARLTSASKALDVAATVGPFAFEIALGHYNKVMAECRRMMAGRYGTRHQELFHSKRPMSEATKGRRARKSGLYSRLDEAGKKTMQELAAMLNDDDPKPA